VNDDQPTSSGSVPNLGASCQSLCVRLGPQCGEDCSQFCTDIDLLQEFCGAEIVDLLECALSANVTCGSDNEVLIGECRRDLEDFQECLDGLSNEFDDGPPPQSGPAPPENPPPQEGDPPSGEL
jgi:hypothetical protein